MTAAAPTTGLEGQIYTHSLKLEETAKGLRISVHVYTNDQEKAIEEAFNTYLKAKMTAMDNKIPLAPVDNNK
jgi:hypothetical protein